MRWGASTGWVLGAAFLLWTTWTSGSPHNSNARWAQSGESRYGMLGKAILEGRTNLGIELPKGLESLENPYLRKNNRSFSGGKLWDTAYYKGKIYIYHGVVPALLLYAPFQQITGTELNDAFALALLCLLASGASCACIRILAGNCPEGWQALAALVATIGPGYAYIIRRADMYEIAIMGGATLTAVSLLLILLGQHRKTSVWTGAAATCWALAVGCRPTAIINLGVPAAVAAKAWREGKRHLVVAGILAATIGVGLGIYNWARFERVWEFGTRYMLTGLDTGIATPAYYSAEIFKYNFPFYALNPPEWTWEFPYAVALRSWHGHAGQVIGEPLTGVVGTTPVAVLAILGAALAFKKGRNRIWWAAITLTWAPALLAVAAVIFTSMRYLLDFTPAMLTASCAVACRWLAAPRRGKYPSWRAATAATLLLPQLRKIRTGQLQYPKNGWTRNHKPHSRHSHKKNRKGQKNRRDNPGDSPKHRISPRKLGAPRTDGPPPQKLWVRRGTRPKSTRMDHGNNPDSSGPKKLRMAGRLHGRSHAEHKREARANDPRKTSVDANPSGKRESHSAAEIQNGRSQNPPRLLRG